jgi:hypothetical protein
VPSGRPSATSPKPERVPKAIADKLEAAALEGAAEAFKALRSLDKRESMDAVIYLGTGIPSYWELPEVAPERRSYSAYSARTEPIHTAGYPLKLRLPAPSTCRQAPANGVFRDRMPEQTFDALMDGRDRQRLCRRRQHLDDGSLDLTVAEPSSRHQRQRWNGARLDRLVRQSIKDRLQGAGRVRIPS